MSLRTLLAIATVLSTTYLAASAPSGLEGVILNCPSGTTKAYTANDYKYTATQAAFYSKIGSFHDSEWYTGPLTSSSGTDNTPGATRSSVLGGTALTEQMTGYTQTPTSFSHLFILANGPLNFNGAIVASYVEELSAKSICGGSATLISFKDVYCSDQPQVVADLLEGLTSGAIGGVADELGAVAFTGACP